MVAQARDYAIRRRLKQGDATFGELLEVMPIEVDLTDQERALACQRAIRRLVIKKEIFDVGDKWRLCA